MEFVLGAASYILPLLLALSILVFVHELGHFLAARLFGMRVDVFSIGFPPRVFGKKVGQTEYRIGAIPLGGYVKIAGMVDESMDTEFAGQPPQPDEFRSKPVWQRIVVITAGVVFNIILAWVVFIGLKAALGESYIPAANIDQVYVAEESVAYEMGLRTGDRLVAVNGQPLERIEDLDNPAALTASPMTITVERAGAEQTFTGPPQLMSRLSREGMERGSRAAPTISPLGISYLPVLLGSVSEGSAADQAGIRPGDRIVSINNAPVFFWDQLTSAMQASNGQPLTIRWARSAEAEAAAQPPIAESDGQRFYEAVVTPQRNDETGRYMLGVGMASGPLLQEEFGVVQRRLGFGEALTAGTQELGHWVGLYFNFVGRLFTGQESVRDSVGGPVMIAQATKEAADRGWETFWWLLAQLSIALAVFNILPIPALDGGHLVFLLYEGITRREPSVKVRAAIQQVGFFLLLAFMAFVIFNDVSRLLP